MIPFSPPRIDDRTVKAVLDELLVRHGNDTSTESALAKLDEEVEAAFIRHTTALLLDGVGGTAGPKGES